MLRGSPLAEVAARAGLLPGDESVPGQLGCVYPARWPGVSFAVVADPRHLRAALTAAAADVDDLWPGRATDDGALSLVAIGLQEMLDVRRDAPAAVVLAPSGGWVTEPVERSAGRPGDESDQLEWRAERD